jgi:hypothetical protein
MHKYKKELPLKMGMHATNAEIYPGAVVEKLKQKCWSKEEIAADAEEKKRQKEERELKKAQGVRRIAEIKNTVAEQDANLVMPKPRPKPWPLQRTFSYHNLEELFVEVPTDGPKISEYEPPTSLEDGKDGKDGSQLSNTGTVSN